MILVVADLIPVQKQAALSRFEKFRYGGRSLLGAPSQEILDPHLDCMQKCEFPETLMPELLASQARVPSFVVQSDSALLPRGDSLREKCCPTLHLDTRERAIWLVRLQNCSYHNYIMVVFRLLCMVVRWRGLNPMSKETCSSSSVWYWLNEFHELIADQNNVDL